MKNQTKTFTKKTELVFTTIEIKRRFGKYKASFWYGLDDKTMTGKVIKSQSFLDCIGQLSRFLDCEIDERHYIIK